MHTPRTFAMTGASASARGFTLIEMLIAVAIAGVLAAAAYPSFQAPLHKARRLDGISALLQLQMSQEQWRSDHSRYASAEELRAPATSQLGHYTIAVSDVDASGYTLVATALGPQASDAECRVLRLSMSRGQVTQGSGRDASQPNTTAQSRRCWGA